MSNDKIMLSARHDPDIFRDVAKALLARIATTRRLNRLIDLGFKDAADAARKSDSY